MSSSRQKSSTKAEGSSRRRKDKEERGNDEIPTAHNQTHAPSSTSWSIRALPLSAASIPPLTTLCMHAFTRYFRTVSSDKTAAEGLKDWILAVPDYLIPRLFAIMKDKEIYPPDEFIAAVSTYLGSQ